MYDKHTVAGTLDSYQEQHWTASVHRDKTAIFLRLPHRTRGSTAHRSPVLSLRQSGRNAADKSALEGRGLGQSPVCWCHLSSRRRGSSVHLAPPAGPFFLNDATDQSAQGLPRALCGSR